ncbi:hypothetical protein MET9862_00310 [Methylobacterium symbioticum]|uniref:Uncharacterized protein n=1 Tax=Methylobacterium symbioticum TaxID=2584084 RepID=A0A509E9E1_9HYPH|nr:hypothetical protein MET9862_00310 [Methylobacterium symbioticum]
MPDGRCKQMSTKQEHCQPDKALLDLVGEEQEIIVLSSGPVVQSTVRTPDRHSPMRAAFSGAA